MSDDGKRNGSCFCGAVKFLIPNAISSYTACHCGTCRKWGSGPLLSTDCGRDVSFEGEENILRYKSSDWAERGFCKCCGSSLFYYVIPSGSYLMSVGLFEDQNGLKMTNQVFIDEKPDCYTFATQTKTMTGAEVFAMFAPQD